MAAHSTWEEVLAELKTYPKDTKEFFIFTENKGTDNEDRSRFFTRLEALAYVMYRIEKAKCPT